MKLKELYESAKAVSGEIEELASKIESVETDEERAKVEERLAAKETEADGIEKRIKRAKAIADRKARMESLAKDVEPDDDGKSVTGDDDGDGEPATISAKENPEVAHMRLFMDYMGGKSVESMSDRQRDLIHPEGEGWKDGSGGVRIPRKLARVMMGKRFGQACDLYEGRYQGKTIQSDVTSDAYLIDEDYLATLLELPAEPGHLLGRVSVIPCKSGTVKIPRLQQTDSNEYGGMSFTWADEGDSKSETEPTFQQVEIDCHELNGYTEISETMIRRNAVAASAIVTRLYNEGIRDAIDTAIISGSGTGRPQGITVATGLNEVNRASAGDVSETDIINLKHGLLAHHRDNAIFLVHDEVEQVLEVDALSTRYPALRERKLLSYQYEVTHRQPEIGNDGDALFGDPTAYYLAMDSDIVVKRSEHYKFRNNLVAFAVYAVVGGQLVLPRAWAELQSGTS